MFQAVDNHHLNLFKVDERCVAFYHKHLFSRVGIHLVKLACEKRKQVVLVQHLRFRFQNRSPALGVHVIGYGIVYKPDGCLGIMYVDWQESLLAEVFRQLGQP